MNDAEFDVVPAVRRAGWVWLAIVGTSSSGKTYSALRVAKGMQEVVGGEVVLIDTENGRGLHYASTTPPQLPAEPGTFRYGYIPFQPPFTSARYLRAMEAAVRRGARTIIVDQTSHEHEGVGGYLYRHDERAEADERQKFTAWGPLKRERNAWIAEAMRMDCNVVWCFRGDRKTVIRPKARDPRKTEPVSIGVQPIGAKRIIFECTARVLIREGSKGVPCFDSEIPEEREVFKIPMQFEHILRPGQQLSEDQGRRMAEWAKGSPALPPLDMPTLMKALGMVQDSAQLVELKEYTRRYWSTMDKRQRDDATAAILRADLAVKEASQQTATPPADDAREGME